MIALPSRGVKLSTIRVKQPDPWISSPQFIGLINLISIVRKSITCNDRCGHDHFRIDHVEAKRQSFQEFYRLLKHEGRLSIFEIPARFNGLKHVYYRYALAGMAMLSI